MRSGGGSEERREGRWSILGPDRVEVPLPYCCQGWVWTGKPEEIMAAPPDWVRG